MKAVDHNQMVRDRNRLSRIRVSHPNGPVSETDHAYFLDLIQARFYLEQDLLGLSRVSDSAFRRCIFSKNEIDAYAYFAELKRLKCIYLRYICETDCPNSRGFKRHAKRLGCKSMHLEVFDRFFHSVPVALQWLSFDEKAHFEGFSYTQENLSEYLRNEEFLSRLNLDESLCNELSVIVRDWLVDLPLGVDLLKPSHGPGATFECSRTSGRAVKDLALSQTDRGSRFLDRWYGSHADAMRFGLPPTYIEDFGENVCEIVFVPKSAISDRVISKENTVNQWLQQSLKDVVYPFVDSHPQMNTIFADQTISRSFAVAGSINGVYATVDFSAASDRVSLELVRRLFSDTYLIDYLIDCRSEACIVPEYGLLKMNKFAPMGSACCFFVMDICLLSMCELAVRRTFGRFGRKDDYWVFGDDVVIRDEAYAEFLSISESCGLSVNQTKTFHGKEEVHHYREACGIEAFDGFDITPLRVSRWTYVLSDGKLLNDEPKRAMSAIDLCNRCLAAGYRCTRDYVLHAARVINPYKQWEQKFRTILRVDLSDRDRYGIPSMHILVPDGTASNYHCRIRRDKNLQKPVVYSSVVSAVPNELRLAIPENDFFSWQLNALSGSGSRPEDPPYVLNKDVEKPLLGWKRQWVDL